MGILKKSVKRFLPLLQTAGVSVTLRTTSTGNPSLFKLLCFAFIVVFINLSINSSLFIFKRPTSVPLFRRRCVKVLAPSPLARASPALPLVRMLHEASAICWCARAPWWDLRRASRWWCRLAIGCLRCQSRT